MELPMRPLEGDFVVELGGFLVWRERRRLPKGVHGGDDDSIRCKSL